MRLSLACALHAGVKSPFPSTSVETLEGFQVTFDILIIIIFRSVSNNYDSVIQRLIYHSQRSHRLSWFTHHRELEVNILTFIFINFGI